MALQMTIWSLLLFSELALSESLCWKAGNGGCEENGVNLAPRFTCPLEVACGPGPRKLLQAVADLT